MHELEKEALDKAANILEAIARKARTNNLDLDDLYLMEEALQYAQGKIRGVRYDRLDQDLMTDKRGPA